MKDITIDRGKGLEFPKKFVAIETSENNDYAKYQISPFEPGFGTTIGNSLRRILLSSLRGAAITAVQIDNVLHEYSSIEGVKEDVTDIILNLKKINLKVVTSGIKKLHLEKKGAGVVTAADIECPANVEIINPDQRICTLSEFGHVKMEIEVGLGRGYVPAEENKKPDHSIGVIAIDSIFSPVRKVNYKVDKIRVGERSDYDSLTIEVYTNASVTPEDAIAFAANILKKNIEIFINFEDIVEVEEETEGVNPIQEELVKLLNRNVEELELSVRSANCLKRAKIRLIGKLVSYKEAEMLKMRNFGKKSLVEIKELLSNIETNLPFKINLGMKELINEKGIEFDEEGMAYIARSID